MSMATTWGGCQSYFLFNLLIIQVFIDSIFMTYPQKYPREFATERSTQPTRDARLPLLILMTITY